MSTRPTITVERYTVERVPGLDLWHVWDTENELPIGPLRMEKIVADMEAGDLNFQLQYDTDEAFRTAFREWASRA